MCLPQASGNQFPRGCFLSLLSLSKPTTMAAAALNGLKMAATSQAYLESMPVNDTRKLLSDLCRHFYGLGWVSGTGGSITIKVHDESIPKPQQLIVMSPSGTVLFSILFGFWLAVLTMGAIHLCLVGVQKERMVPEDMYVLSPSGCFLSSPSPKPYPNKPPKCSDCAPLFMKDLKWVISGMFYSKVLVTSREKGVAKKAYLMRNAGAVIHSHGMESCIVTMIDPLSKEFRITHMEMIKGIQGHGYYDELVVPIIENTAHERELTDALAEAIEAYPKTTAVLVRNHGIYIWGDSWIHAKTQAECYHYLFDAAIKLYQLGLDWSTPDHGPIKKYGGKTNMSVKAGTVNSNHETEPSRRCIVLDIEGTTTPISFVTDVLFPFARNNVSRHLAATYETDETQDDIKLLRTQVQSDLEQGIVGAVPIPPDDAGKEEVIAALVANVEAMIKADRKITALKQLQGHIWRTGFQNNELEGVVFEDVPEALQKWHASGIKVTLASYESTRMLHARRVFCVASTVCEYFLLAGKTAIKGTKGCVPFMLYKHVRDESTQRSSLNWFEKGMNFPSVFHGGCEEGSLLPLVVQTTVYLPKKVAAKVFEVRLLRSSKGLLFAFCWQCKLTDCSLKQVYIYSSGSRLAQRLLFGYTNYGDLRKYLCGFFDTTVGNKRETKSYVEITESVGVDKPSEILFVTDVYQEAVAAKAAGLEVIISIRPGNGPLPDNHGFKTITSFSDI
ncbi:putative bifunctional methylthioribulose-1-phosphate dehydratase/enolase-phosphatase E1 1 [Vitis vinifera]|uniref:Putative bifunctional methylthioribulose-1-phosphate dehydratase/enolase-phosphatase E1 1 n=1 Tax=Vitis vinifera TaxID=29760 RepID=A0A438H498_VITVI|nr:putative bifunctional methylthioribulose-1-phosphate dehydratase/enolase-phosphatase E1 1 [Vitis vinifera]